MIIRAIRWNIKKTALVLGITAQVGSVEIIGHRGASFDAPENTVPAFQLAWKQGSDAIEADFWLTSDHQIVCCHNRRHLGVDVTRLTLQELRAKFPDMPTLEEVMNTVPPKKTFYLELKHGKEIVPHMKKVLEKSTLPAEQIVILSFDPEVIKEVRQELPHLKAYYSIAFTWRNQRAHQRGRDVKSFLDEAEKIGATGLCLEGVKRYVTELLEKQKKPLPWVVWTVDDKEQAKEWIKMGAQGIITNVPNRFIQTDHP